MALIILYLGNKLVDRFSTEDGAKNAGALGHTSDKPAKIEFTPDSGGLITTLVYDPSLLVWSPVHSE
jgi:hypothetical protein